MINYPEFSLAFLTVADCSPLEAISVASQAGYGLVGLRLLPATLEEKEYSLLTNNQLLIEVKKALSDTGVKVADVELIRLNADFDINNFLPFLNRVSELGAKNVTVVGDDADRNRLIDNFECLCGSAAEFELTFNLEPIPWTAVRTLDEAMSIIHKVNKDSACILIDALHFYRSEMTLDDLSKIPENLIRLFQICDAPALFNKDVNEIRNLARTSRLIPGEGGLDLLSLIERIPKSAVVSIEVPNSKLIANMPPLTRALEMLQSTKELYSQLPGLNRDC